MIKLNANAASVRYIQQNLSISEVHETVEIYAGMSWVSGDIWELQIAAIYQDCRINMETYYGSYEDLADCKERFKSHHVENSLSRRAEKCRVAVAQAEESLASSKLSDPWANSNDLWK